MIEMLEEEDVVHQTCPCCRHRFIYTDPKEIKRGGWRLTKISAFYHDLPLSFTKAENHVLYLLAVRNVPISAENIGYAVGGLEADNHKNLTFVYLSRIRKKLHHLNIPIPFKNIWGRGYMWYHAPHDIKV